MRSPLLVCRASGDGESEVLRLLARRGVIAAARSPPTPPDAHVAGAGRGGCGGGQRRGAGAPRPRRPRGARPGRPRPPAAVAAYWNDVLLDTDTGRRLHRAVLDAPARRGPSPSGGSRELSSRQSGPAVGCGGLSVGRRGPPGRRCPFPGERMHAFVGRQPELATLRARLAAARAGGPQVVVIEGPPGSGRPRGRAVPRRSRRGRAARRPPGQRRGDRDPAGVRGDRSARPVGGTGRRRRARAGRHRGSRSSDAVAVGPGCWSCSAPRGRRPGRARRRRRPVGGPAVAQGPRVRAAAAGRRPVLVLLAVRDADAPELPRACAGS